MQRPHASDDVRERALAALDEGRSVVDIAAFFQNDPSTIRRWRRPREATGSGLSRPRSGRPPTLTPVMNDGLRDLVARLPDATVQELADAWAAAGGVGVSRETMGRRLRTLGITRKKRP